MKQEQKSCCIALVPSLPLLTGFVVQSRLAVPFSKYVGKTQLELLLLALTGGY